MPQCKAKSKRSGEQCKNSAMKGRGTCRFHGGKTPGGIALPQFKDGRYSKYIPARLTTRYEQGLADGRLLELGDEIALLDSRLTDLLSRVDDGESASLWGKLIALWRNYQKSEGLDRVGFGLEIDQLIEAARDDYLAWNEIHTILEQRRKLVESERKRLVEIQQTITAKEAMTLIAALLGIIKDNVTDRDALQRISTAVNGLIAAKV